MARYYFEETENGQIREEYIVIEITDHYAEIDNDDEPAMLLAEKRGGVIEVKEDKPLLTIGKSKLKSTQKDEEEVTNG